MILYTNASISKNINTQKYLCKYAKTFKNSFIPIYKYFNVYMYFYGIMFL